ncbi:HAAS signaling domain-containing protein [Peribacillus loiseleuriae]|uniref:HAAS signaling domain-containing protein n=1 Tax=Peribacillus loiseleuriae TaxID=1679170 RepID=UPI003D05C0D9
MSKKQFLSILEKYLRKLPKNEKEEILQDYEEYFTIGVEEGKTESQIVEALGSPKQLAKELIAVYAINKAEEKKSIISMFTALFSIMGLSVMNCIIIIVSLFVLLILIPFILAYIIGVPIMILSPLILIVMGFVKGFSTIGVGEISESIKGLIIGSFLAFLGYYIGKSFVRLFIKYLKWNMSIARGKKLL